MSVNQKNNKNSIEIHTNSEYVVYLKHLIDQINIGKTSNLSKLFIINMISLFYFIFQNLFLKH